MVRLLGLLACLVAAFALFYQAAKTPDPLPASAPANVFSAGRAVEDIKVIAAVPHPIGSPANAKVRDYLVARMQAMGLSPRVQRAGSAYPIPRQPDIVVGATVENVIGVLPGRNRDLPALALMAHYDSVEASPGAADDAAGVATALEVIRAIKLKGTPARDVMLVITDGEEAGLLGAHAFYAADPQAAHVGFVMNMESRGGGGRAAMFQTGADNGEAIALFQKTAAQPDSNSLAVFIYKLLPNDTDMTVTLGKGLPGLNFAFIGRQFDYHSPSSTVAVLDKGAVQHMGGEVMGTAMALAFSDKLPGKSPDVVYGNLPLGLMAAYPPIVGWALLLVAAAGTAYGAYAARRAMAFSWRDLWKGVGAGILVLIVATLLLHIARLLTGVPANPYLVTPAELLARFPLFELAMFIAGLAAVLAIPPALARGKGRLIGPAIVIVLALVFGALGGFQAQVMQAAAILGVVGAALAFLLLGRPAGVAGVWTGMLAIGVGVAVALQIAAPTAAMAVAWPVTAAAVISGLLAAGTSHNRIAWPIGVVLMALALSWVGALLHGFMQGLDLPELPALVLWTGALIIWPLAWPRRPAPSFWSYAPALAALGSGMIIALYLHATSPWSARYPQPTAPLYLVDHDSGQAWRVGERELSDWTRKVLIADGGAVTRKSFPTFGEKVSAAPAKPVSVDAPAIAVTRDEDGVVTMTAPFTAATRTLALELKVDTVVSETRVNGESMKILGKPGQVTRMFWHSAPEGLTVSFKPTGPGALDVRYAAYLAGWPPDAKPLPPMPPTVMGRLDAGSTVVIGKLHTRW